ncbi:fimbria/pilus outer membrane usher protein [Pseudocitrobacter cyperus]|uniref:Fimbria/pilus outer membrane usher protein n=1 Tax=Pseudocitrobacter cyperus TaxID=3112843 RepID=A0ABV0HHD9_9ENTR
MTGRKSQYAFLLLAPALMSVYGRASAVTFNTDFLAGGSRNADMSRFYRVSALPPGEYPFDVYINDEWKGRLPVHITDKGVFLQKNDIEKLALSPTVLTEDDQSRDRVDVNTLVHGGNVKLNAADMSLRMSVPQAYVRQALRGYVDPAFWDEGITALTLGYSANYNYNDAKGAGHDQENSYFQLNSGLNAFGWVLRDSSSYNKSNDTSGKWSNSTRYLERGIAALKSIVRIGDSYSSNDLFDSLRFRGISMGTDMRMLPDSQQSFSPVVRGVAQSNALVKISQNGQVIYQKNVSPGPFEIADILPTGSGGDLDVEVIEADGRSSRFIVPFSSVPNMLQEGLGKYGLLLGKARAEESRYRPQFAQASYQYGFSNLITGYTGAIYSDDYNAFLLGSGLNLPFGAVSFDVTQSQTQIPDDKKVRGQSYKVAFSRFFNLTGTNFALAAYRYSTKNYYSFNDAIALHNWQKENTDNRDARFMRQKNTFNINLSQSLGDGLGSLYLSGTWRDYWNGNGTTKEYQLGYSNHIGKVSYTLSASSTRNDSQREERRYYLTLSVPLELFTQPVFLNSGVTFNRDGYADSNLGVSGTAGAFNQATYNLSASNRTGGKSAASGSLSYRTPFTTLNGSYSESGEYRQAGVGASGSLVAWRGGVLTSSQLGDTFAIIDAPGAAGATLGGDGTRTTNSSGKALVPYLSPYRKNRIQLDTTHMVDGVELKGNIQEVVPYAGSVTYVRFETDQRRQFMLPARASNGQPLPFGTEIVDDAGNSVGYVAQGGMLYLKAESLPARLHIKTSSDGRQSCTIVRPASDGQINICR